jgi:glycine oxidase
LRNVATSSITVVGAGIFGLWQALVLARAGHRIQLIDKSETPFTASASRWAGAMIAPDCEAEGAPAAVRDWGREGLDHWRATYPGLIVNGTLVVAAARDQSELTRFHNMTQRAERKDAQALAALEPDLAGRFNAALYYAHEAHMDAGAALAWLRDAVHAAGAQVSFGANFDPKPDDLIIDCRGMGARHDLPKLRGVRGERIIVSTNDMRLSRPVRLLHPRQPIYVVPQGDGRFVIGATVIEREDAEPMTVKSALDLMGTAYALHPAFAEASIIDMGAGIRPAFPDNIPRILIAQDGRTLRVNGAYRHGFLLAPVLAHAVADYLKTGARHAAFTDE